MPTAQKIPLLHYSYDIADCFFQGVTYVTSLAFVVTCGHKHDCVIAIYVSQEKNRAKNIIIAELQRAKRASGAPWVRKFGKPSSPENLVIT